MDTYLVTLADDEGRDRRVLVRVPSGDTEADVHAFITDPATRSTTGEAIDQPSRVIGVRKLHIRRPVRTNLAEIQKSLA